LVLKIVKCAGNYEMRSMKIDNKRRHRLAANSKTCVEQVEIFLPKSLLKLHGFIAFWCTQANHCDQLLWAILIFIIL